MRFGRSRQYINYWNYSKKGEKYWKNTSEKPILYLK